MAVGSITIIEVNNKALKGNAAGVVHSVPVSKESLDTSGTSQVSASTIAAPANFVWRLVFPIDVWIQFGETPVASVGNDFLLPAYSIGEFSGVLDQKVAVIEA